MSPDDRSSVFTDIARQMVQTALLRTPNQLELDAIADLPTTEESLVDLAAALGVSAEFIFR